MSPFRTVLRVLTFRFDGDEIAAAGPRHLLFGLAFTWLVGIGRYWDNPRVPFVQKLGLGSVAYVFLLSAFLFLLLWPIRPARWRYFTVLTFVTLVSPPALLYAMPVERWFTLETATTMNFWFLALVALWRVCLLGAFLGRYAGLQGLSRVVATLLPLSIIVFALAFLNLERAVFEIMAGNRSPGTSADGAYAALAVFAGLSMLGAPVLLLVYAVLVIQSRHSDGLK